MRDRTYVTADNIKTLAPGRWPVKDAGGLYLLVSSSGSRSWTYRYMLGARQKDMGLGSTVDVKTVTAARKLRDDAALLKAKGVDPIEERRQRIEAGNAAKPKAVKTFEECAKPWHMKLCQESDSPDYCGQVWRQLQRYAFPTLGRAAVDGITTDMVLAVLQPHWATKNPTMSKVRGYIEAVLDWAKAAKQREGDNPATWRGNLKSLLSQPGLVHSVTPHPAVPWEELPAFMANLRARNSISARLLEFTILTAARTEESLYARIQEVSEPDRAWTVPADRMKGRKNKRTEHRVPLSDRALAICRELAGDRKPDAFLFAHPDGGHLSTGAMDKMMELMGTQATAHGTARASFSTWRFEDEATADKFDQELVEASLHHKLGEDTMLSYQRGKGFERRRKLMQAWADHCASSSLR